MFEYTYDIYEQMMFSKLFLMDGAVVLGKLETDIWTVLYARV